MHYLAVVGSREFWDKQLLFKTIDQHISLIKNEPITLVSGGAKGADSLAALYAKEHSINIIEYLPDWSIGKYAGLNRNHKIIEKATDCVIACLVDGLACKGTKHSVYIATKLGKTVIILNVQQRKGV